MRRCTAILAVSIMLAACGRKPAPHDVSLDDELSENAAATANDPALRAALRGSIMVDPTLVGRANADAIRPPVEPYAAAIPPEGIADTGKPAETDTVQPAPAAKSPCPQCSAARGALTLAALAEAEGAPFARCAGAIGYSAAWASRLPDTVPLYPRADVIEAAGADGAGCMLRAVNLRSSAAPGRLLDWYATKLRRAGLAVEHRADGRQHVLAASRPDGTAALIMVGGNSIGGSEATLLVGSDR
ncbi:conserved hypothetical protein [Sphingomonas sp. EC-HK361]|uniref:hypothetical protein n=1 Tax=Sphingomonas sp. EC-HK361 TaxID=2038397 RepID=UPI0012550E5F|nr:hypothetical protein [Sphingomonas sp. EC-HK361]VVT08244.1 conserved hypothetical protein [Sphingomonas sp. EC-HK361]